MNTLDKLGGWLLFICAVCFVAVTVTVFFSEPQKPVVTKVELTISTDSTGVVNAASIAAIDSLAQVVKKQNRDVIERYSYMVEQKEHENGMLAFGSVIISIILAIFGFFGYKSFRSIENKAVANAKDKANVKINTEMVTIRKTLEKELIGTIDKRFGEEYQERLGIEVGKKLNENYNEAISSKLSYIDQHKKEFEDLQTKMTDVEQFISFLRDQGLVIKFPSSSETKSELEQLAEERKRGKEDNPDGKEEGGEA